LSVSLKAHPQVLCRGGIADLASADVLVDLPKGSVDERAGLVHRLLGVIDEGRLHLLPLIAQPGWVIEQPYALRTAVGRNLIGSTCLGSGWRRLLSRGRGRGRSRGRGRGGGRVVGGLVFIHRAAQLSVDESAYSTAETFSSLRLIVLLLGIHLLPPWPLPA